MARRRGGGRRGPLIVIGLLVVLVVGGVGAVLLVRAASPEGRFAKQPNACRLLSQEQVRAYLPGAVFEGTDAYYCSWSKPAGASGGNGDLSVGVEVLGSHPSVRAAKHIYGIRRRQSNTLGTTITPVAIGDESFMACKKSTTGAGICEMYTRASNVLFSLRFRSYPARDAPDPATALRALGAQAVQYLDRTG